MIATSAGGSFPLAVKELFVNQKSRLNSSDPLDVNEIDFLSILNHFDEGVIISDSLGRILFYNQTQAAIDGLDPREVIGRHITEVYRLTNETSLIMHCLRSRQPIRHRTLFYKSMHGKIAHTICSVFPLLNNDRLVGAICFVRDYRFLKETMATLPLPPLQANRSNATRYTFADIIGANRDLTNAIDTARGAADSKSPVLLIGETGTGKELFAQAIHNHSSRRDKTYNAINCAAIPENLLEGLLFGTVKGAFTGAIDRPGLIERANGSTLFLDELLSMPITLQVKLLRVLQEKKVCRLGSEKEIELDIKIISSISKTPREAMNESLLRVDLFYRLGVVLIRIPPLRRRLDDLPLLIQHFLDRLNNALGTYVQSVSPEVMELFAGYAWPGNIRELEHLLEGAMNIVGHSEQIRITHFSAALDTMNYMPENASSVSKPEPEAVTERPAAVESPGDDSPSNLQAEQKAQEKSILSRTLTETGGNITRAAVQLGISRQLLTYKMKKHGLSRSSFQ